MRIKRWLAAIGLSGAALLLGGQAASAQVYGGAQLHWGSDTDLGVGGRVLANLQRSNLEMVGSFDIYFPDGPVDFWDINANLFYHFHLRDTPSVLPYAGGGLNISHFSNGSDSTELGLNLGGGVRFPLDGVSPFIEVKTVLSDHDQSVLTFGLIVGHAHGHR